jgi:hypothetical protein
MNALRNELPRIAVDEVEAARAIGMSIHFLRKDRRTKRIIPFFKIGDCVRYDLARVREALIAAEEGGVTKGSRVRGGRKA